MTESTLTSLERASARLYADCMAQWPTDTEVLGAVDDAGWLLEHHAARTLDAADTHPRLGWAYPDPDEPTNSRELDVWSYKEVLRSDEMKLTVSARFLVECKQSSQPYVGIGRVLPSHRFSDTAQHILPLKRVRKPADKPDHYWELPAWGELGFRSLASAYGQSDFRMTQLTRLDRKQSKWEANNAGIFTSLVYPLAKALRASHQEIEPRGHATGLANPRSSWLHVALHFPVVLIGCPLYVVDATHSTATVAAKPWATAQRQLKSKNVSGDFELDFVTKDAFADYVADRLKFAQAVADMVNADPLKFTGESGPPRP